MRLRKGIYYHYVHHMRYSLMYVNIHHETLKIIFDHLEGGGTISLFHAHMVPILSIECTFKTLNTHSLYTTPHASKSLGSYSRHLNEIDGLRKAKYM